MAHKLRHKGNQNQHQVRSCPEAAEWSARYDYCGQEHQRRSGIHNSDVADVGEVSPDPSANEEIGPGRRRSNQGQEVAVKLASPCRPVSPGQHNASHNSQSNASRHRRRESLTEGHAGDQGNQQRAGGHQRHGACN